MTADSSFSLDQKSQIKVGVIGLSGKVGSIVSKLIQEDSSFVLVGGTSSKSSRDDFQSVASASDVLVDFSVPKSTIEAAKAAEMAKIPFVSGTTGISTEDFHEIEECAKTIPILYTSNFSIAIHLMASFLQKCSNVLQGYDAVIIDKHHKNKKDAPSGTSLFLAKCLNTNVQMLSVRAGNMPAEMECEFCGENEMFTLSHRAFDRKLFAKGALDCAKWIIDKSAGMYSMNEYIIDL